MSRPSQLALIALVYVLGTVIAVARGGDFDRFGAVVGLAILLPIAASVHYANEYADYETDEMTTRTPFSGGSGALQTTGLPRRVALRAAFAALGIGIAAAIVGCWQGMASSSLLLLVIVAGFGWSYSLPPGAFVWRGFGEPVNAGLGGIVLPLYGFAVQTGEFALAPILACLPFALVVFVNLLETHWPDREADAAVGKSTLVVRWSPSRLRATYVLGSLAYVGTIVTFSGRILPPQVATASLVVVPLLAWGAVRYTKRELPLPAVLAMVLLAVIQVLAWGRFAGFL
jgi:1,4-dihydroxy-2-naphthoate octaprenyltransferase